MSAFIYIFILLLNLLLINLIILADFLKLFFSLGLLYILILFRIVWKLPRESTNTVINAPFLVQENTSAPEFVYLRECFHGDFWYILLLVKGKENRWKHFKLFKSLSLLCSPAIFLYRFFYVLVKPTPTIVLWNSWNAAYWGKFQFIQKGKTWFLTPYTESVIKLKKK